MVSQVKNSYVDECFERISTKIRAVDEVHQDRARIDKETNYALHNEEGAYKILRKTHEFFASIFRNLERIDRDLAELHPLFPRTLSPPPLSHKIDIMNRLSDGLQPKLYDDLMKVAYSSVQEFQRINSQQNYCAAHRALQDAKTVFETDYFGLQRWFYDSCVNRLYCCAEEDLSKMLKNVADILAELSKDPVNNPLMQWNFQELSNSIKNRQDLFHIHIN